ncbi:MAG: hypothetical protein K6B43_01095 [Treponema sp.]|nr:hypothetical protein [Treponema sp.]
MYKIRFLWRKIIAVVSSFITVHFLAACRIVQCMYGMPEDEEEILCMYGMPPGYGEISGTVTGNADGKEMPLANVKIYEVGPQASSETIHSEDDPCIARTDNFGRYYIDRYEKGEYTFRFEDGDGAENGLFKSKEETISYNGSDMTHDVSLELDDTQTDSTSETTETTETTGQ